MGSGSGVPAGLGRKGGPRAGVLRAGDRVGAFPVPSVETTKR